METQNPLEAVMELGMDAEDRVREASLDPGRRRAAHTILQIEREATESLRQLESSYRVSKPRVGITRALQREWRNYQEVFQDISTSIRDIRDSIESVVTDEVAKSGVDVSARARVESALNEVARLAGERGQARKEGRGKGGRGGQGGHPARGCPVRKERRFRDQHRDGRIRTA